jgi:type VI secretion system ImpM family protein
MSQAGMGSGAPFAFGKLPSHGDFVSRGLEPAAREAWDAWASAGLEQAQAALGEGYDLAYSAAPPWRFAFGPGAFGTGWRAGAFACSVDKAGRRFPIIVGLAWAGEPDAALDELAEASEAAIYEAFAEGDVIDTLVERLARIAVAGGEAPRARFWTLGGERHPPLELAQAAPDPALLVRALTPDPAAALAEVRA